MLNGGKWREREKLVIACDLLLVGRVCFIFFFLVLSFITTSLYLFDSEILSISSHTHIYIYLYNIIY